ncbi:metallophosphoesterase [Paenibacillus sp. MAHUQ-46]|uniref:Metallophosphoesterase n=1 Tax=Paenibacillus roseus TaxID=2798579 RepID=A0A934J0S0_9BACL|nr:metallophosphoesterase [Paenibacillus roseus]
MKPEDYGITRTAMEDIAAASPDLIIPLGDFGSQGKIGSVEGLEEAEAFLRQAGAPLRPILGNHDMERESGPGKQPKGTMQERFLRMFELDCPYGVLEYDNYRFFFAATENQSPDSCYDVQEVFATDEQFDWLKAKLKERPGVPVIFFTHAPPVGAGLRTVPRVHVRSTNAYLDENHNPYRWYELFKHTPEIVLWFSAHYHLSHGHPDSHTYRFGTHFFMTGVHGAAFTRDGNRQSRILDIDTDGVKVLTLDHIKREVTEEGGWAHTGQLDTLVQQPRLEPVYVHAVSVGEAPAVKGGLVPLSPTRCIVSTTDGFSWEAEPWVEGVFGTYHIGPALTSVAACGNQLWMAWGNEAGATDRHSPWRFVRDEKGPWPFIKTTLAETATALAAHPAGGVWVAAGHELKHVMLTADNGALAVIGHAALEEPSAALIADGESLWSLSATGKLYAYDAQQQSFVYMRQVLAWDSWSGYNVSLHSEHGQLLLTSTNGHNMYVTSLPAKISQTSDLQVISLGAHRVLAIAAGEAYAAAVNRQEVVRMETGEGKVATACRAVAADSYDRCDAVYVSVGQASEGSRPLLQKWTI